MHTSLIVAYVDTPSTYYGNVYVVVDSDDDVTAQVTVRNRIGNDLVTITGPFEPIAAEPGGWIVHTDEGDVTIQPQEGCGCGGSEVRPK